MRNSWIALPYCVALTDESAWRACGKFEFSIVRAHYLLRERQVSTSVKLGEVVTSQQTPHRTMDEWLIEMKQEHSIIQAEESVRDLLISHEETHAVAEKLGGGVKIGPLHSKADIRSSISARDVESLKLGTHRRTAATARTCTTFRRKLQIRGEESGRTIHVVYGFQRFALDVYLVFFDYLRVYYARSYLGLRRKLRKWPTVEGQNHRNLVPIRAPIGSFHYWKLLPELQTVDASRYQLEVDDPFEIEVNPIVAPRSPAVEYPRDEPTLYQISHVTFPRRWTDRAGPWTREELVAIEREVAEADADWWQLEGIRRKRR